MRTECWAVALQAAPAEATGTPAEATAAPAEATAAPADTTGPPGGALYLWWPRSSVHSDYGLPSMRTECWAIALQAQVPHTFAFSSGSKKIGVWFFMISNAFA